MFASPIKCASPTINLWRRHWMTGSEDAVFKMFRDNWAVTSDLNKLPSELYSRVSERWLENCNKCIGFRGFYFEIDWSFNSIWSKLMSLVKKSQNLLTAGCNYVSTYLCTYLHTGWARKKYTEIIVSCALTARAKFMIFCTNVAQKVAKQMPVNLVQDDGKYQRKYVWCRDMHFGHITAGNYRRRFLSNSEKSATETCPWE